MEGVDEDSGRVRVINGFDPFKIQTIFPFQIGEEVKASLSYETMINYCHKCLKIFHVVKDCLELGAPNGVNEGVKRESQKVKGKQATSLPEENMWEVQKRRPVKRTLHMTDFASKEEVSARRDYGHKDRENNQRPERSGHAVRVTRGTRNEGSRDMLKEVQNRGLRSERPKELELDLRVRHGRTHSKDRGGSSIWPASLHKVRAEMEQYEKAKVGPWVQSVSRVAGASKQNEKMVMNSEENMFDSVISDDMIQVYGQFEEKEDDLLAENGEFLVKEKEK